LRYWDVRSVQKESGRALLDGEVNKANADVAARATAGHGMAWRGVARLLDNATTQPSAAAAAAAVDGWQ